MTRGLLHGFIPAVMTETGAQSQQRIHIGAFPMHAWPFKPLLDDAGVGTLCAATPTGPSLLLKERRVHQGVALLQGMHLFSEILYLGVLFEQATHFLSHVCGTVMLELM